MSISNRYVPDEGPEDAKIVLVGEAPGAEEERLGQPFIGESGNKLMTVLGRNGLSRDEVRLANLCHYRPESNRFELLLDSPQLAEGLEELYGYLNRHRPVVVCALGNWPLYFLTGKHGKTVGSGIKNWRGSILSCSVSGLEGLKVIPTVHPAAVLREGSLYPLLDQDIRRVKDDSAFPELRLPQREFNIAPQGDLLELATDQLLKGDRIAVDIETFGPRLACVGFSDHPSRAVCVVWNDLAHTRDCIYRILASEIPKTFHFGSFDTMVLEQMGFQINGYDWDTMVAQHVMWPELPRALKTLSSIYTREPYYKDEGKESAEDKKSWGVRVDRTKLWTYNCKDAAVTAEVQLCQAKEIDDGPKAWREFVSFEMEMVHIAGDISHAGLLRDQERRGLLEAALALEYKERQAGLVDLVGHEFNARSHPQAKRLLYQELELPERRNRKGKLTSDVDALVSLLAYATERYHTVIRQSTKNDWLRKAMIVKLILLVRQTLKVLSSYVLTRASDDGRVRSLYKVPATETGRWSAEKFVDGTGLNSQTLPRDPIEVPDELTVNQESVGVPAEVLPSEDDDGDADEGDSDSDS